MFPNSAQDSPSLPHNDFLLPVPLERGSASLWPGAVSPWSTLSFRNSLSSWRNMPACEPKGNWRNIPKAVGVTTTLVTSQKILVFPGYKRISREDTTSDVTGKCHNLLANYLYQTDQVLQWLFQRLTFEPGNTHSHTLLPELQSSHCFITTQLLRRGRVVSGLEMDRTSLLTAKDLKTVNDGYSSSWNV